MTPEEEALIQSILDAVQPIDPNGLVQALQGEDLRGGSPAGYVDFTPNYRYDEVQNAAQQISDSGVQLVDGNSVYNTGNHKVNQALYGNDIYQNLSYGNQGFETPRQFQSNSAVDNIVNAMAYLAAGPIGGAVGGAVGGVIGDGLISSLASSLAGAGVSSAVSNQINELGEEEELPDIAWQLPDISDTPGQVQIQIPDYQTGVEGGGGGGSSSNGGGSPAEEVVENPGELTTGGTISPWPEGWYQILDEDGNEIPYEEDDEFFGNGTQDNDVFIPRVTITNGSGSGGSSGAPPYWGTGIYGETPAPWSGNGSGPTGNGMGPDGAQSGTGTGPGPGSGGGDGSGDGSGDGDGDGDGNGDGTGNGSGSAAVATGSVSDAEWGELFPYTKLSPAQKKGLLPHIDYIRGIKGL